VAADAEAGDLAVWALDELDVVDFLGNGDARGEGQAHEHAGRDFTLDGKTGQDEEGLVADGKRIANVEAGHDASRSNVRDNAARCEHDVSGSPRPPARGELMNATAAASAITTEPVARQSTATFGAIFASLSARNGIFSR